MKKILFLALLLTVACGSSQEQHPSKIVLITLDGLRWQELFTGADASLISNGEYVKHAEDLREKYWFEDPEERRTALFPFLWKDAVKLGRFYGNRLEHNKMNVSNSFWFSYPGYNEILTGRADDSRITSNNKANNPNITILEAYNNTLKENGKVAAFGSWDVFPFIINEGRSGIPVNAGFDTPDGDLNDRERFLNELQEQVPSPWKEVRFDAFTHHYALAYMRKHHPNFIYIAYGETDDFAHDEDYEAYLNAAHNTDNLIKQLWDFTMADPFYRDQTLFVLTTDHGRGANPPETWSGHGKSVQGSDQVWMVVFGKGVEPVGEVKTEGQLYSSQIAPTLARVLGLEWEGNPIGVEGL